MSDEIRQRDLGLESNPSNPRRPKRRGRGQMYCAVAMCIFGMLLMAGGFFAPPIGEIASSVLVAYGEVMTFAGALFGIDYHAHQ